MRWNFCSRDAIIICFEMEIRHLEILNGKVGARLLDHQTSSLGILIKLSRSHVEKGRKKILPENLKIFKKFRGKKKKVLGSKPVNFPQFIYLFQEVVKRFWILAGLLFFKIEFFIEDFRVINRTIRNFWNFSIKQTVSPYNLLPLAYCLKIIYFINKFRFLIAAIVYENWMERVRKSREGMRNFAAIFTVMWNFSTWEEF